MSAIFPLFEGLMVIPSASAGKELARLNLLLSDAVEVLKNGFDCSGSKRKKGVVERCSQFGGKTLKVVAVKSVNYSLDEDCWLVVHVGVF